MNVLVYAGPEVLPASLKHTLTTLRRFLLPNYSVQPITLPILKSQPWSISCALFVFPECRSTVMSQSNPSVNAYVEGGGTILCFSAGAHCPLRAGNGLIGSNTGFSSPSDQPLRFLDKKHGSFIYPNWRPGTARFVDVQMSQGTIINGLYRNGQSDFAGMENIKNTDVLATYAGEDVGKVAVLKCHIGAGKIIFCGISPEFPLTEEPASLVTTDSSQEYLALAEHRRKDILGRILSALDLSLSSSPVISRPFPQFLVSHPAKHDIVPIILDSIAHPSSGSELNKFEDANDTFQFCDIDESGQLLAEIRQSQNQESDPSTWQPKLVLACRDGKLPNCTQTPLFDLDLFFHVLSEIRAKEGCFFETGTWGFGEAMFYGEVVTSTQTMLDKNPRFLVRLPTPILSLASHQLAGRGRGTNSWISPPGCLQFSLHLRLSLSMFPANKLVFVQYLFALAVVEACREEALLGKQRNNVRIKWPNDIYAVFGNGEQDRKKIGGILVNTSFSDGKVDIIIGCGVNVLNPPPTFSLQQLQPDFGPPLSMEKTTAIIMGKFEKMWHTFVEGQGNFEPFISSYLERWLHSDQLVLLTTTDPPKSVRICGITLDHGLLRTLPERAGWGSESEGFIDLQPDGNSFDLMLGLIKSKS